jgi:hypothetical protein
MHADEFLAAQRQHLTLDVKNRNLQEKKKKRERHPSSSTPYYTLLLLLPPVYHAKWAAGLYLIARI